MTEVFSAKAVAKPEDQFPLRLASKLMLMLMLRVVNGTVFCKPSCNLSKSAESSLVLLEVRLTSQVSDLDFKW